MDYSEDIDSLVLGGSYLIWKLTCESRRVGFVSLVIIFITKETNVFFFFCGQILGSLRSGTRRS